MSERLRNTIVGITAVLGLAGIALMMTLFGFVPGWLEDRYAVTFDMNNAGGLTGGSSVRLNGKPVGRIDSVRLGESPRWSVTLIAMIDADVRLPAGVKVSVESSILGGTPVLGLRPPVPEAEGPMELVPDDGSGLIKVPHDVPTLVSQFAGELRSALKASIGDLKAELDRAQGNLDALCSNWVEVGDNLNLLLRPLAPGVVDGDESGRTLGNISTVVARADKRLRQFEQVLGGMRKWVADEQLKTRIHGFVQRATALAGKMDGGVDEIVRAAREAGQSFDRLSGRFVDVADELGAAVKSLRGVIDKAARGEGSVGKAMTDPALFNNMNDAVQRLGPVLDEFRMFLEKWQTEGLPLNF